MTTEPKAKGVDVKGVLDDIWHRGLCGDNVLAFEEARAAVAELILASRSLEAVLDAQTEWEDGCCYYNHRAAPELEIPMRAMADALKRIGGEG